MDRLPSDCWVSIMLFVPKWVPILSVSKSFNILFKDLIKLLRYDKALSFFNREYGLDTPRFKKDIVNMINHYQSYTMVGRPDHTRFFKDLKSLNRNYYNSNELFITLTKGLLREPVPFDLSKIGIDSNDEFSKAINTFIRSFNVPDSSLKDNTMGAFAQPDWSPLDVGYSIGLMDSVKLDNIDWASLVRHYCKSNLFTLGLSLGLGQNTNCPIKDLALLAYTMFEFEPCLNRPEAIELFNDPKTKDQTLLAVIKYIKLDEETLRIILERPDLAIRYGSKPVILLNPSLTWELIKPHLYMFKYHKEAVMNLLYADFDYLKETIPRCECTSGLTLQCIINPRLSFDETNELIRLIKFNERNGPDVWSDSN